jgi:hypothetical protein
MGRNYTNCPFYESISNEDSKFRNLLLNSLIIYCIFSIPTHFYLLPTVWYTHAFRTHDALYSLLEKNKRPSLIPYVCNSPNLSPPSQHVQK